MERAINERKKEIENDLLLEEVNVWEDLDKEQNTLVQAERKKLVSM